MALIIPCYLSKLVLVCSETVMSALTPAACQNICRKCVLSLPFFPELTNLQQKSDNCLQKQTFNQRTTYCRIKHECLVQLYLKQNLHLAVNHCNQFVVYYNYGVRITKMQQLSKYGGIEHNFQLEALFRYNHQARAKLPLLLQKVRFVLFVLKFIQPVQSLVDTLRKTLRNVLRFSAVLFLP